MTRTVKKILFSMIMAENLWRGYERDLFCYNACF